MNTRLYFFRIGRVNCSVPLSVHNTGKHFGIKEARTAVIKHGKFYLNSLYIGEAKGPIQALVTTRFLVPEKKGTIPFDVRVSKVVNRGSYYLLDSNRYFVVDDSRDECPANVNKFAYDSFKDAVFGFALDRKSAITLAQYLRLNEEERSKYELRVIGASVPLDPKIFYS